MKLKSLSITTLLLFACSSNPSPQSPDVLDPQGDYPPYKEAPTEFPEDSQAALTSPCGKACENLRKIPCKEGYPNKQGVTCYHACIAMAKYQRVPAVCWSTRKTPAEVRECGGIECSTP